MNKELLQQIGDFLHGIDDGMDLNFQGMNRYDIYAWPEVRNQGEHSMCSLLKKYKGQIISNFGEEAYEKSGLADFNSNLVEIVPCWNAKGEVEFPLQGRVKKSDWQKYLDICREFLKGGRSASGSGFVWMLKADMVDSFNFEEAFKSFASIGIELKEIPADRPEVKVRPSNSSAPTKNTIEIVNNDGLFSISFSYNPKLVEFFSNRGGKLSGITEYNTVTKARETYQVELVIEIIEKLEKEFPEFTIITSRVDSAINEHAEYKKFLSKPLPKVMSIINPDITPFIHQNEGINFFELSNGNCILGDEMGLGKTLQTLAWLASNGKRALVVCPKVIRRNWCKEGDTFFPGFYNGKTKELVPAELRKNGMPDLRDVNLASINFESVAKYEEAIREAGFDAIIIDESHRMKNEKAKVTKTLFSMRDLFAHRILLSGTAIKNKKVELFTQVEYVRPGFLSKDQLNRMTIGALWNKLQKENIYLARQKSQVLKDLPAKSTQIVELNIPSMPKGLPKKIDEMTRYKNDCAIAKASATAEFVQEILDSSDSHVIVFSESLEAAKIIAEKTKGVLHHGQMSDDERERVKEEFQAGKLGRVFVSTRQSLAIGATITIADKVVFNDIPWTPADVRQAEDRAHRIGQLNNVNVYWITGENNQWDMKLTKLVLKKYTLAKMVTEGKQFSKEEREWMDKPVKAEELLFAS